MTHDFIEKAVAASPDVLICEGTRVAPVDKREDLSEREVYERCFDLISNSDKLAITCFYGRDIDRMKTYHLLARKCDRKFVVSMRVAHLLRSLVDDPGIEVPDPLNDEHMLVYSREMDRARDWEEEFEDCSVDSEFVRRNQRELILHLDFNYFTELIDIKPERGSLFIHSMSEPIEENDEIARVRQNWVNFFGLEYHQAHASGHLSKVELAEVIKNVNPKRIIPIHTEHSELFKEFKAARLKEVIVPVVGRKYKV
jgi:ribonuclease J